MSDETVVLVAGADDRFAMPLTVALSSALRKLDRARRCHVYVIDGGMRAGSVARCRKALERSRPGVRITFARADVSRFARLHATEALTRAAYLRLLIPEIVSPDYRRVLYIDCDTVVTDDVAQLWSIPDDGTAIRAVLDAPPAETMAYFREELRFADVPPGTPYFNSGVLLIDLDNWRRARISERAEAVLAEHSHECRYLDQDALNVVAIGHWAELPSRWNVQVFGSSCVSQPSGELLQTAAILHFLGPEKPWYPGVTCLRQDTHVRATNASGWFTPRELLVRRLRQLARRSQRAVRRRLDGARRRFTHRGALPGA